MPNYPKKPKKEPREAQFAQSLEELQLFEEWRRQILPELRDLLMKGATAKDIFAKYEAHAAARLVTVALTDPDAAKALTAAKDISDRVSGKATENKRITHQLESLTEEQLDALIASEQADLDDMEENEGQVQ